MVLPNNRALQFGESFFVKKADQASQSDPLQKNLNTLVRPYDVKHQTMKTKY